ncbi:hypothetical protein [Nannocystis punicea]|uniref:Uncharacterized protein n=1 Tax=Nannocystis punicea TaxID=2995304 RepID=A0ABY7GU23_9BACT|nr:hypothetical protein [Nannocystis poenicansa]WAS90462.1 hypothetical protein O0S08_30095 [Nannocystis poenicansa]
MPDLLVRRALLDRPQRLGFLPTWWFWNDHECQRLVRPLITAISLPLTALLFFAMVQLQWPFWTLIAAALVWPQLVCGLVERHVRAELRRALAAASGAPAPLPADPRDQPG